MCTAVGSQGCSCLLEPLRDPRNQNPILALIGDDIALSNELVFKAETALANEFPAPAEELERVSDQQAGQFTYADAIAEQQRGNEERIRELKNLRQQVLRMSKPSDCRDLRKQCSIFFKNSAKRLASGPRSPGQGSLEQMDTLLGTYGADSFCTGDCTLQPRNIPL